MDCQLRKDFSHNLKICRYKANLTQQELANIMDVSTNYVSRLESGRHTPSFEMLELLSKSLNISPHELFVKHDNQKLPSRVDMLNDEQKEVLISNK